MALATPEDIETEISRHLQETERPVPDDVLMDLPTLQPPIDSSTRHSLEGEL